MSDRAPIKHEALIKRSVAKSVTTIRARFQLRFFKLFEDELTYWTEDGKHLKGSIKVDQMRACERVDKETFKKRDMFQVVYVSKSNKMRVLYVQGSGHAATRTWVQEIGKLIDARVGENKYTTYHRGAFLKSKWSCCKNEDKYAMGCTSVNESDHARTVRLSRNISNVSTMSPGMFRTTRRSSSSNDVVSHNGSWEDLGSHSLSVPQINHAFVSDDEYTDDEL